MLSPTDRSWMKELNGELWSPEDKRTPMEKTIDEIIKNSDGPTWEARKRAIPPPPPLPREKLTNAEVLRIFEILRASPVVAEPVSYGMICGIALRLWDHENFVGTGPEHLLTIADKNLPAPSSKSWHRKLLGADYTGQTKIAGGINNDAWDLFMLYSKADRNLDWLKQYNLTAPRERLHYEY
jgi:hypothetical protein